MFGFTMLGKRFNAAGSSARFLFAAIVGELAVGACAADEIIVPSAILSVLEKVNVPAPEAGILDEIPVREGERVKPGQLLAQIDSREQQLLAEQVKEDLTLAQREAASDINLRLAEKEHEVAGVELQRATSVNSDFPNTVSAKEVDRLKLAVETTKLKIEYARFEQALLGMRIRRIEADLKLAQHRVDRHAMLSPIGGILSQIDRSAGEWVDKGELVLRVVRVDRLKVEGYVGVNDAMRELIGRPVEVQSVGAGGKPIRAAGVVKFVSPEAEPVDAQVRFWAEIDNSKLLLRPGMTVSVRIGKLPTDTTTAARTSLAPPEVTRPALSSRP